jgi:hypothetical protein
VHAYSQAKDFVAGPSLELRFSRRFSLEANALFRQLHLMQSFRTIDGTLSPFGKTPVVTWEIPLLAKYRLLTGGMRPFVEGGPSFRTTGNLNSTQPSHRGITAGIGVEMQWRKLKISPAVRYTRWQQDNPRYSPTLTKPDQVEFVLGFSAESASHWRPLGSFASIGLVLGTNLTPDFAETTLGPIPFIGGTSFTYRRSSGRRLIIGPSVIIPLPHHFTLEVDALYRPVVQKNSYELHGTLPPGFPFPTPFRNSTVAKPTWEFPILFNREFTVGRWRPFLGAGPTFRRPQGLTHPSPFGAVAAAGIDLRGGRLGIQPSVRFNRWGADDVSEFRRSQSELLVGFHF